LFRAHVAVFTDLTIFEPDGTVESHPGRYRPPARIAAAVPRFLRGSHPGGML
jgi:hypothetical protein